MVNKKTSSKKQSSRARVSRSKVQDEEPALTTRKTSTRGRTRQTQEPEEPILIQAYLIV